MTDKQAAITFVVVMKKILVAVMLIISQISFAFAKDAVPQFQIGAGILKKPVRIACANGFVYVCDTELSKVLCFDTSGKKLFESGDKIFVSPTGITVSGNGELVVCDSSTTKIVLLDRYLGFIRDLKLPDEVKMLEPYDLCFDQTGVLNVLDRKARTVFRLGLDGKFHGQYMQPGIGENKLSCPQAIASNGKGLAIADAGVGKIIFVGSNFMETKRIGNPGSGPLAVRYPTDICFDRTGNMLVTDRIMSDVNICPTTGTGTVSWGMHGAKDNFTNYFFSDVIKNSTRQDSRNYMDCPTSVAVGFGCVYVADSGLSRIIFEKEDSVYKSPKTDFLPFASQPADVPPIFCDQPVIDFGMVKPNKTYNLKVKVHVCGSGYTNGKVRIAGNYYNVEPKSFIGSAVTLYITHIAPGKSLNNATMTIECNGYSIDIPITAACDLSKGVRFVDSNDSGFVKISSSPASLDLNLLADPGVVEMLTVSSSRITYKTSWSRVARGVDELTITTLTCSAEPSSLVPAASNTIKVTLTPTGSIKPGVYSVNIKAADAVGKYLASRWFTVIVLSNNLEKQSTVVQEVFTAHWCEPCAYQREAGYRLFCEYGPRFFMPAAYHVMDDADFMTTGMTRPEHYDRFKYYGGQGVPVVVNNGEEAKLLPSTKQLAHDRISGRKYSGTTNDYLKMRGDFDFSNKFLDYQLNVSGDISQDSGYANIEAPGYSFEKNTENELIVLLTEDDIEFNAANGEDYHHFAVRLMINGYQTNIYKSNSFCRIEFSIPKMPDGYQIIKENSRIVAFIQNKNTKKMLGTGWFKLNNNVDPDLVFYTGEKPIVLSYNALVPLTVYISNPSVSWKSFRISSTVDPEISVKLGTESLTIGSCSTVPLNIKIDTTNLPGNTKFVTMKLNLEQDSGKSFIYELHLPVMVK